MIQFHFQKTIAVFPYLYNHRMGCLALAKDAFVTGKVCFGQQITGSPEEIRMRLKAVH
ncbi:MAG: hypothetical protein IGS38_21595 [Synechococcales cyanobacterium M58_A2018_015]|nr:hypothetical protein [Synechococcales cyanobacterium M58_A2018_015]